MGALESNTLWKQADLCIISVFFFFIEWNDGMNPTLLLVASEV